MNPRPPRCKRDALPLSYSCIFRWVGLYIGFFGHQGRSIYKCRVFARRVDFEGEKSHSNFMKMLLFTLILASTPAFSKEPATENLKTKNLVAWCIVPFDASKRGPAERAKMLTELGIKRCAYDWRKEHVPEFEQEILEYKKHGIEFFAFWGQHENAFALFEKYDLHPQIWLTLRDPGEGSQEEKISKAAESLKSLAEKTAKMGCKLGLYNHGGWGGEPENLVAVCKKLHQQGHENVGIVYNWHHGHEHIGDWAESLALMKPFFYCLNLNGMNPNAEPKILALGTGKHEAAMLKTLIESGYDGPIGILDHQNQLDSKIALQANLEGLAALKKEK